MEEVVVRGRRPEKSHHLVAQEGVARTGGLHVGRTRRGRQLEGGVEYPGNVRPAVGGSGGRRSKRSVRAPFHDTGGGPKAQTRGAAEVRCPVPRPSCASAVATRPWRTRCLPGCFARREAESRWDCCWPPSFPAAGGNDNPGPTEPPPEEPPPEQPPSNPPPPSELKGSPVYAVDLANRLLLFGTESPETINRIMPITGLPALKRIVGIDFRPSTGALYGVGNDSRVYVLDTLTGAATPVGSAPFTPRDRFLRGPLRRGVRPPGAPPSDRRRERRELFDQRG